MISSMDLKGYWVWFDGPEGYRVPGRVLSTRGTLLKVQTDDGAVHSVNGRGLRPVTKDSLCGNEDMITLPELHEGSLLYNLRKRYKRKKIYTYTGNILVAVNPYETLSIYNLDAVDKYSNARLGDLPPHIFAIANEAYIQMTATRANQCVVISGESGAGKTESMKLIMKYIAVINKEQSMTSEQILESNPIMESFGNARTVRNDNSSRFGKYVEMQFNADGMIRGAKTSVYLLEKSRVVHQSPGERNYHIFYELLAGIGGSERAKLKLGRPEDYNILRHGGDYKVAGKQDGEDFFLCTRAMEVVGFQAEETQAVLRTLAAILHLGNIKFAISNEHAGMDACEISNKSIVDTVAELLQVSPNTLHESLTHWSQTTRGERILSPLNVKDAMDKRNAVSKALYARMFDWIIARINQVVCQESSDLSIGVLDIFGFENFTENSFEQLCINHANENLQFFFNMCIFRLEQEEYEREGINWARIEFKDNQGCLDLISKRPTGVIFMLDDECNLPRGTDATFLEKLDRTHAGNPYYSKAKQRSDKFTIAHYAGKVDYNSNGFLERNKDTLHSNIIETICSSRDAYVRNLFQSYAEQLAAGTKKRTATIATEFHRSLTDLVATMGKCNSFFVRCMKPNATKKPSSFDNALVLEQLRYSGMLETIRIRRAGFPVRYSFDHMEYHYRCLHGAVTNQQNSIKRILTLIPDEMSLMYQMGYTKVFMREPVERFLEDLRVRKLHRLVTVIQAAVRGFLARRRYQRLIIPPPPEPIGMDETDWAEAADGLLTDEERREGFTVPGIQRVALRLSKQDVTSLPAGEYHLIEYARNWLRWGDERFPSKRNGNTKKTWRTWASSSKKRTDVALKRPTITDSELQDIIVHSLAPIEVSMLRPVGGVEVPAQNQLAVSSYVNIMRYMGDHPRQNKSDVEIAHSLLLCSAQHPELRDELYMQLIKQLTQNSSRDPLGAKKGWSLLLLCAAYFAPTEHLLPYLRHYARGAGGFEICREFRPIATLFESYILRTVRCGGRKILVDATELEAISSGRYTRTLKVFLASGDIISVEINTVTIAQDIVIDICSMMDVTDFVEYGLFMYTGPKYAMPLQPYDYILDACTTLDKRRLPYRLVFQKMLWYSAITLENPMHTSLVYHQAALLYNEGLLITVADRLWNFSDIALLAALQYRLSKDATANIEGQDPEAFVDKYIAEPLRGLMTSHEWLRESAKQFNAVTFTDPVEAKRLFVEAIVKIFPIYGSSFFAIRSCTDPRVQGVAILAVDRHGLSFLDEASKEVLVHYPFTEIISTRRFGSYSSDRHFVDLNVGNLVDQKIIRCESPQSLEITTVITRYIQKYIVERGQGKIASE